jgi:predicted O-linked N-acetylglucosamine transferase (SPINDLY family)
VFNSVLKQLFRIRGRSPDAAGARSSGPNDTAMTEAVRRFDAGDRAGAQAIAEDIARNDPRHHQAWNLLGALAAAAERHELAVRHFERAIALEPANAGYLSNCGEVCRRAGWIDDAIDHCRAALAADPRHMGAYYNLALALHAVGEVEQAHAALTSALEIQPDSRAPRSALLFLLCHHLDIDGATLLAEHRRWNELHARALAPVRPPRAAEASPGRKLRVGYVSADFRRHSLAYFVEPLLANHDRNRFDVVCYSNTRHADEVTDQLRNHVSQWRDITALSDEAAATLIAQDGIDILVDLSGHTADNRLLVFARKPAPVQLSYLGYPNTTGLAAMDYRVSDGYMDPPGVADALYTEKLLRMPHSLWCYRPPAPTPDVNPLPALQRGVTTFGSLHSFTKISRQVIDLWARILARQPGSELLMAGAPSGETGARLRAQFAAHGVDAARVHLIGKLNFDDYLKLYHRIDIGLDAFPYAGGTTTCESLWMGVPVVTLAGAYGVARAGVSLLTSARLAELVADSPERYVEIATDLARDPRRLAGLRGSLRERMQRSPLMDEAAFTRAFEAVLRGAFQAASASTGADGAGPSAVTR